MPRSSHTKFYPPRAQLGPGLQPLDTQFHDVLVIPALRDGTSAVEPEQFYRLPVIKTADGKGGPSPGKYVDAPELWDRGDVGERKVLNIAHPDRVSSHGATTEKRGPAFAVMPVKQEPGASSCAFCYLVDAEHVLSPNAWTAEEWDAPGVENLEPDINADKTEAECLLALPRGVVLRIRATGLESLDSFPTTVQPAIVSQHGVTYEIEPVNLRHETEIWGELRNGCIAGRVLHRQRERVIPLLNVTSLMPRARQGENS